MSARAERKVRYSKLTISTRAPGGSSNSFFSKTKFRTSKKYYSLFFDLFLLVESPPHRLYHDFGNNLYILCDGEVETISYSGDWYRWVNHWLKNLHFLNETSYYFDLWTTQDFYLFPPLSRPSFFRTSWRAFNNFSRLPPSIFLARYLLTVRSRRLKTLDRIKSCIVPRGSLE